MNRILIGLKGAIPVAEWFRSLNVKRTLMTCGVTHIFSQIRALAVSDLQSPQRDASKRMLQNGISQLWVPTDSGILEL
jgi:hypothetical protein